MTTRQLLERAAKALALVVEFRGGLSDAGLLSEIRAELAKPERNAHTEAEVQELLELCDPCYSEHTRLAFIRRTLGVPAP